MGPSRAHTELQAQRRLEAHRLPPVPVDAPSSPELDYDLSTSQLAFRLRVTPNSMDESPRRKVIYSVIPQVARCGIKCPHSLCHTLHFNFPPLPAPVPEDVSVSLAN